MMYTASHQWLGDRKLAKISPAHIYFHPFNVLAQFAHKFLCLFAILTVLPFAAARNGQRTGSRFLCGLRLPGNHPLCVYLGFLLPKTVFDFQFTWGRSGYDVLPNRLPWQALSTKRFLLHSWHSSLCLPASLLIKPIL